MWLSECRIRVSLGVAHMSKFLWCLVCEIRLKVVMRVPEGGGRGGMFIYVYLVSPHTHLPTYPPNTHTHTHITHSWWRMFNTVRFGRVPATFQRLSQSPSPLHLVQFLPGQRSPAVQGACLN